MGVPQVGVLSSILFNLYIVKIATSPQDVDIINYADDCTILISGTDIARIGHRTSDYLATEADFF